MEDNFDVLVIGAGSAGSVIANYLSQDERCNVGLIEAGQTATDPDIKNPSKWPAIQGRDYDWAYKTTPQTFTNNRVHDWPRGRIIGGSSCLHAMAHVRGHPDDFEPWRQAGGDGWSYDGLLPHFKASETYSKLGLEHHGYDGPLDVCLPSADEINPVVHAFMAAGAALNVPQLPEHNGRNLTGTSVNSLTIKNGQRLSAADAYLPAAVLARPNLSILAGWEIERLEISGNRVTSVSAVQDNEERSFKAERVVLCAGAVSSPLILMRSGIGDPEILKSADIACKIDSPEVGRNLQDHLLALGNVYISKMPVPPTKLQHSESLMYLHSADITRADGSPDIVLACVVAPSLAYGLATPPPYGSAYTILCGVTHPSSRGSITPTGPTRKARPLIDPCYLETGYDRTTFRNAIKIARQVGHHPALHDWREQEYQPGLSVSSDTDLDTFLARSVSTHHHPCGTCRMGSDKNAVVSPDLALKGLDNLSVVDASVFPQILSGPIHASVLAVAEKWASDQII